MAVEIRSHPAGQYKDPIQELMSSCARLKSARLISRDTERAHLAKLSIFEFYYEAGQTGKVNQAQQIIDKDRRVQGIAFLSRPEAFIQAQDWIRAHLPSNVRKYCLED